jgi:hypothetical protein
MYATPQLLDHFVWVPVRNEFIRSCGHTGLTVLDSVMREMEPPFAMNEAAEHALPLFSRLPPALDPVGSVPGSWLAGPVRSCAGRRLTLGQLRPYMLLHLSRPRYESFLRCHSCGWS